MLGSKGIQSCRFVGHAPEKVQNYGQDFGLAFSASGNHTVQGSVHLLHHPIALRVVGGFPDLCDALLLQPLVE